MERKTLSRTAKLGMNVSKTSPVAKSVDLTSTKRLLQQRKIAALKKKILENNPKE